MKQTMIAAVLLLLIGGFASASDPVMGIWEGKYQTESYDTGNLYARVIAEGQGAYRAVIRLGYDSPYAKVIELPGKQESGKTLFSGQIDAGPDNGGIYTVNAEIVDDQFTGRFTGSETSGTLTFTKVQKKSPTLGMAPPSEAIVLFDGKNLDQWTATNGGKPTWVLLPEGVMEVRKGSIITKKEIGDMKLHLEFRTPFKPEVRGQDRGNSGVYIQGRYEVQILDSFGLEPKDNECGGIYKVAAPKVNACLPPLDWQTYDITFLAPRFDDSGKKIKDAVITVELNGVVIHNQLDISNPTGGARDKAEVKQAALLLQDHGNPVQFRNIWYLPMN